ncbi:TonB-dependent receptor [Ferrimonas marina]|uniref:TonB dependent receptor n=1 Tax=Ferrimonas marina TaxID=299255 RepID=A0A1M5MIX9_9GAMM|nr:TonB-dependent receptor [Ferrimonas marina]SHG77157.1 TonB dependent receptor [Ferrimonas marina]
MLTRKHHVLSLAVATALYGWGAQAEEQAEENIEVIEVTAQKRVQRLQDVPVSIAVIDEQELALSRMDGLTNLAQKAPNVSVSSRGSRADTRVTIRGIANIGGRANNVGIYVDGFNIAPNVTVAGGSRTADMKLIDPAQIEVLRGPQGTYFGRNTMGGVLNISTVQPSSDAVGGEFALDYSSWNTIEGKGALNVPLGDTAAMRVTGYYDQTDGFLDNAGSADGNSGENYGGRVGFNWQPTDRFSADAALSYSKMQQDNYNMLPSGQLSSIPAMIAPIVNNGMPALGVPSGPDLGLDPWPVAGPGLLPDNEDTLSTDLNRDSEAETTIANARLTWDLGAAELVSITGYINNDFAEAGDGDMTVYPSFLVSRDSTMKAWSQEFQLRSSGNNRLNWLVGAIVGHDEIEETDYSEHLASDPYMLYWDIAFWDILGQPPELIPALGSGISIGLLEDVDRINETDTWAVFGNLDYQLTDHWKLGLGGRYSSDTVTFTEVTRPNLINPVNNSTREGDFSDFSPRADLTWQPSRDLTLYTTVSRAYKAGGFNPNVDMEGLDQFDEESGVNYEFGIKGSMGNQLRYSTALYYFDWADLQVRGQDVLTQRQFIQNAAEAHAQGIELDVSWEPIDSLKFHAGIGFQEVEFDDFKEAITTDNEIIDATGNAVPYAPELTYNLAADWFQYDLISGFDGRLRLEYSYMDEQYTDVENSEERRLDSYGIANARYQLDNGTHQFTLYVENLADEFYLVGSQGLETYINGRQMIVGEPRRFGASYKFRF